MPYIVTRNELAPIVPTACKLCGLGRRLLEPPVLYCVGMSCGMQKIKRNSTYYTKGSQQNIWCDKCYSKLKESETIMLDDGTETRKSRLHEARHDSLPEETWVTCDGCQSRVHQMCALTSDRIRKPGTKFFCPKCNLKNRKGMDLAPAKNTQRAQDLQKCEMSVFVEEGVLKALEKAYDARATSLGVPVSEVEKCDGITIRVLSHIEKKHTIRDEVRKCVGSPGNASFFALTYVHTFHRCTICTLKQAVRRTFQCIRNASAFFRLLMGLTCLYSQCMFMSMVTAAQLRIGGVYISPTWILYSTFNRKSLERLHINL